MYVVDQFNDLIHLIWNEWIYLKLKVTENVKGVFRLIVDLV